jgi:hypothetical protein
MEVSVLHHQDQAAQDLRTSVRQVAIQTSLLTTSVLLQDLRTLALQVAIQTNLQTTSVRLVIMELLHKLKATLVSQITNLPELTLLLDLL